MDYFLAFIFCSRDSPGYHTNPELRGDTLLYQQRLDRFGQFIKNSQIGIGKSVLSMFNIFLQVEVPENEKAERKFFLVHLQSVDETIIFMSK